MIFKYIAQHKLAFITYFIFAAILIASFALYRFPIEAVAYPILLCALIGVALTAYGVAVSSKKHARLKSISQNPATEMKDYPPATDWKDDGYIAIIESLKNEAVVRTAENNRRYTDMAEYYTTWAHQIKSPISSMRLKLQSDDSEMSRRLSAELNRIEQYVEMALTYARLDSDTTDYVFKEYDLDGIIKQALRRFSGEFIARRLKLEYAETNLKIVTDEKWLLFIIEQVLSNALKYTPVGTITVRMSSPSVLSISDTGIGIAPEDLPRIFEKGYTGITGREDKKASGIGLYLCRRISDNLGISIYAESLPGKGTTVYMDFTQKKASSD